MGRGEGGMAGSTQQQTQQRRWRRRRQRQRLLCCCLAAAALLMAAAASGAAAAEEQPASKPPAKEQKQEKQEQQQQKSNIIPHAGEAALTNGIGDVKPDGACAGDVKAFCKDFAPGQGRLFACLQRRAKQAKQGNIAGRKVSEPCLQHMLDFQVDRSTHINKNPALATACKEDAERHCKSFNDGGNAGSNLRCLRANFKALSAGCQGLVLAAKAEVARDYRLEPLLFAKCEGSVRTHCRGSAPGNGEEIPCLLAESKALPWDCLTQVLRVAKEDAGDIRLNLRLFRACQPAWQKFCAKVEPGHMRVQECLEDKLDEEGFPPPCKAALEEVIAARVKDFRLDAALQEACGDDLVAVCSTSAEEMEADEAKRRSGLNCLQQFKDELHSDACRNEVHRRTKRASRDIRFDELLAGACSDDRKRFCDDVQPGSARVIRCLQEHRASVGQRCAAALFDHEVRMAEDIDFNYPTRRACAWEARRFCKNVPHGHARVVRCLQDALGEPDMGPECKQQVMADQNRAAQDYRLNWRLNNACGADIKRLCAGLCPAAAGGGACGGLVLQCLQDRQDNITSAACGEEVFYYQLMEVNDFRNDVMLAEACRGDVDKYCRDVEPGEGRVHTCLRFHKGFLSPRCAAEEGKLASLEFRDIRLRPKLAKVCSEERAVHCRDVKPGKARVVKCLVEAMDAPGFGEECRAELAKREQQVKNDYRYDVGVQAACGGDIDALCADQKARLRGNASVLRCLVDNHASAGEECQSEMSRAVRFALWDYQGGQALTQVCDADVDAHCPKGAKARAAGMFTIGAVGRCLSKALVQGQRLADKCRALVLVAAPRDARVYLQYPESTSALVQKVAELQRAAGVEALLVDPYRRSGGSVTVTGWLALACVAALALVSLGGLVVAARRLGGWDRPQARWVKSGDA